MVSGGIALLDTPEDIVAFLREEGGSAVLCAFNLGNAACRWTPPGGWHDARLLATHCAVGDGSAVPELLAPGSGYWATRADG